MWSVKIPGVCIALSAALAWGTWGRTALGHNGGIVVQSRDDKLVTGFDDESSGVQTLDVRAFSLLFPSSLANDVPSFLSFAQPPEGSDALPPGGELFWDFLPMNVDGTTSNLLYWDGLGAAPEEVAFGQPPQDDLELSMWTDFFEENAVISGAPEMVSGKSVGVVSTTGNNLRLHEHRWFFLESATETPAGIYLFALQLRTEGLEASDPFYIVAGTDEIPATTLDEMALPWVEARVDALVLDGDFDFDGDVDGSDLLTWQRQYGATGPFPIDGVYPDATGDGVVDGEDLARWSPQFGSRGASNAPLGPGSMAANAVPEPESHCLCAAAVCAIVLGRRLRLTAQKTADERYPFAPRRLCFRKISSIASSSV